MQKYPRFAGQDRCALQHAQPTTASLSWQLATNKMTPEKDFNLCKTRVPGRYHFYWENPMLAKDASNLQGPHN